MFPALSHVWAARRFANGVQIQRAHDALQILIALASEEFHPKPVRPRVRVLAWGIGGTAPFEMMLKGEAMWLVQSY